MRMTRREAGGLLAGAGALAASRALAASAPARKSITLLVRRAQIGAEDFRIRWLAGDGATMRRGEGLEGLTLSEPLRGSGAAAPAAPFARAIDGIENAWHVRGPVLPSLAGSVSDIVDGDVSCRFAVREQVVVPVAPREGAIKRTLLMVRSPGMSPAEFLERWSIGHASLAIGVPGLLGCIFNHIEASDGVSGIDGIAELWWAGNPGEPGARVVSPGADAWLADGDGFTDRARTRVIVSLEHVIIAPPAD